jgi:hypothetical protein
MGTTPSIGKAKKARHRSGASAFVRSGYVPSARVGPTHRRGLGRCDHERRLIVRNTPGGRHTPKNDPIPGMDADKGKGRGKAKY